MEVRRLGNRAMGLEGTGEGEVVFVSLKGRSALERTVCFAGWTRSNELYGS